jgi:DNA invertase Pin-like site-specific DNA recombinase
VSVSGPTPNRGQTRPLHRASWVFNVLATFERSLIAEWVKAGMARAKKQGKRLGLPRAVNGEWAQIRPLVERGQ